MDPRKDIAGLRVLVVEDEMMVSLMIEDVLISSDCIIVGPFDRVPRALEAARTQSFDAAVLDVNIAGTKIYPVAEMLAARGIPFLLLSGYGSGAVPDEHPDWRVCDKPFKADTLVAMLAEEVTAGQKL